MKLLVVDDEELVRDMIGALLDREGVEISYADSCAVAFKCLSENRYDLITLDHCLPDGDSLDILRQIAKQEIMPRVIMVSGDAGDEEFARESLALGAERVIGKPFDIAEFTNYIYPAQ